MSVDEPSYSNIFFYFWEGGKTVSLPSDPQFNLFLLLSPEQIANSRWILDSNFTIAMPASFITSSNWAGNFGAIEPSREGNDLEDTNEKGAEDFDARMYVTGSCQRSFPLRTTYISVPFHSIFLPRSLALNGGPQKSHEESHPIGEKIQQHYW